MAIGFALRRGLLEAFTPSSAKELTNVLNAGVFIASCSPHLRMELAGMLSPQAAKELVSGLSGGGVSASPQLRSEIIAVLGEVAGREFITSVDAVTSSSSSGSE